MIKIVSFFEEHIEKVILAIVGLVCLWLLVAPPIDPLPRVLFSPNAVSYENRKFSPGSIDDYIGAQAELLRQKLDQPSTTALPEPNKPAFTLKRFVAVLGSAVSDVDTGVYLPQPYSGSRQRIAAGKYHLPDIGEVSEVAVEHIRAVAYVPIEEITEQNTYDKAGNEPNDIDLVTVEAKFDVAGLNKRFHECFASEDVPAEWRDPCLAKPVFAAVQLQRQELNPDGSWSDWQTVPRIKIDHLRRLFEVIEDTDKLPPGGIKVRLVQFDNREVMMDLLQPPVYQIASADQEWFPPSLHKKFVETQKQQEMEEKRKALEEKKSARDEKQQEQRTGTQEGQSRLGRAQTERLSARSPGGTYYGDSGGTDVSGSRTRTRRIPAERRIEGGLQSDSRRSRDSGTSTDTGRLPRRGEQGDNRETDKERLAMARELSAQQAMSDIYNGLNSILITLRTDLSKMREPLVFWAHDDTAEPKKTYRYRIRLGVFNPIAGTPVLSAKAETGTQQDKSRVKNVILWSEFSSPTQTVEIPGVLYFFAKGIQEAARKVTVQVSKYMIGYWHSEDFLVGQGEVIGRVAESKPPASTSASAPVPTARDAGASRGSRGYIAATAEAEGRRQKAEGGRLTYDTAQDVALSMPETIDYSTGAVLVDVVLVNDWSGGSGRSMLARHYFDMLYSFDGTNIEHTPVDMKYWTAELRTAYGEIQNLQKEPREPLRAWGTQGAGFGGIAPTPLYRGEGYDARPYREGGYDARPYRE